MRREEDLARIEAAAEAVRPFTPGDVDFELKSDRGDELTAADQAVDDVLRRVLPRPGEGWFSEESVDDHSRLSCRRVWVVDPIDGTREFVMAAGGIVVHSDGSEPEFNRADPLYPDFIASSRPLVDEFRRSWL